MVLYGIVSYRMVWNRKTWHCTARLGKAKGMISYGMQLYGIVWYGMVSYGIVWYRMVSYGIV